MKMCIGVLKSIIIYVLSFIHCHGISVYFVLFSANSSVNAAGDHLSGGIFMEKALN